MNINPTLQISVDEITQHWAAYLQRVQAGETFVIAAAGKPFAMISPMLSLSNFMRPIGLCRGEFRVPDDFDAPLPEHLLQEFEGQ